MTEHCLPLCLAMEADIQALNKFLFGLQENPDPSAAELAAAASGTIASIARSGDTLGSLSGLDSAIHDLFADLPRERTSITNGLAAAAKALASAAQTPDSPIYGKPEALSRQQDAPAPGQASIARLSVSRRQCLEILAAGFFGLVQRDWHSSDTVDLPGFDFQKLWRYDCRRWDGKNFVLMAVLLYFARIAQQGEEFMNEMLVFSRKTCGPPKVRKSSAR